MEHVKDLLETVRTRLVKMAEANAVVGKPISVGDRHIVPLVELSAGFGGGGGLGGGPCHGRKHAERGEGGGAGAGTKVAPVALLVIEGDDVRVERLD